MNTVATLPGLSNRITDGIARMEAQIADRLESGRCTPAQVAETNESLDMDIIEYCKFQELKTAMMDGPLKPHEAQTIYGFLGETVETFNGQPVHVKAVLTQVFAELLRRRIGGAA